MMNYSDYDSDGYSSNEDADYVPSDDNLSEDDMNECEKEDPLDENDGVPHTDGATKKKRKNRKGDIVMRKKKKGGLKMEEEEKDGGGTKEKEAPQVELEESGRTNKKEEEAEVKQKQKADDLWASFLSDVGSKSKLTTPAPQSSSTEKANSSVSKESPSSTEPKASEPAKPPEPSKITITKVFDFAGEEVRVTKEVSADSREAKGYLKSQSKNEEEIEEEEQSSVASKPLPGPSTKRPGGMSSILGRIGGKKPKISTLEKSKMDWDAFKSEEGITEELAIHNRGKEGYVERKNFLERVDHRQYELEKAVRLNNMKR
ncbi:craniofacial development protein 1 [Polymixia lowei]